MKKKEILWIMEKMMRFMNHAEGCSAMEIKHNYMEGKLYKTKKETFNECDCGCDQLINEINDMKIFD